MQATVLNALNALYHHDDRAVKDEADRFLLQFQQSQEAWSIADAILHDASTGMEAQWFAAQTLRVKVQKDFEELPESAINSLRESLMTLLLTHCRGSPPVRTQLCLTLASLTVHVPKSKWTDANGQPSAGGSVGWFASHLQSSIAGSSLGQDAILPCLLEILIVIPQESSNFRVAVRPERRKQLVQELASSFGVVIDILTSCLSASSEERSKELVIDAFGSWLRLIHTSGGSRASLPDAATLSTHPLTDAALGGLLGTGDLFHVSVDAVCELVWLTVDPDSGALLESMMPLVSRLVPAAMELRPRFSLASQRLAARRKGRSEFDERDDCDDDEEGSKGMARLFAEVAEAYLNLIVTASDQVKSPVEAMIEVSLYQDYSISQMSFVFWNKLAKNLTADHEHPNHAALDASDVERKRRIDFYKPAYERLIYEIQSRVKYSPRWIEWDTEQIEDFKRMRVDATDSLDDAAAIVGFGRSLSILIQPLQQLSSNATSGQSFDWRSAEAALYCIRSISFQAPDPTSPSPPGCSNAEATLTLLQLLRALPGLPTNEPKLQRTACLLVSAYCSWLSRALPAGLVEASLPQQLMQMAATSLMQPLSSDSAARALGRLTESCGQYLSGYLPALQGLYRTVVLSGACCLTPPPSSSSSSADGPAYVAEADVHVVIKAVCAASLKCVPSEGLVQAATSLLQPVLEMLQSQVNLLPNPPPPPPPGSLPPPPGHPISSSRPQIIPLIDRLSSILQGFSENKEVVALLLSSSWLTVDSVMQKCTSDTRILEAACKAIRYGLKGAGKTCGPLIPLLIESIPKRFYFTRHCALLYIMSEVVKQYGDQPGIEAATSPALHLLIQEAASGLSSPPGPGQASGRLSIQLMAAQPDLTDDTLLMATRALNYCPLSLLSPPAPSLPSLVDLAMLSSMLQHREACLSALSFLTRLIDPGTVETLNGSQGAIEMRQAMIDPRLETLLRLLLSGAAGGLPPSRIPDLSITLSALLRAAGPSMGPQWMAGALSVIPEAVAAQEDKQSLLAAAGMVASGNEMGRGAQVLELALSEFGDLCTRTKRTMAEAQRALVPRELHAELGI